MSSEKTAEKHADALIELLYPGCPVQKSSQRMVRIYNPKTDVWQNVGQREDVFGVFDRVLILRNGAWMGIQITSDAHMSDRRKKVDKFIAKIPNGDLLAPSIEVWGWRARKGMLRDRYTWNTDEGWLRAEMIPLLPKRQPESAEPLA